MRDAIRTRLAWLLTVLTATAFATGCSSHSAPALSVATPPPDPGLHEKAVAGVYELARRRDVTALLALGVPVSSSTPSSSSNATDGPVELDVSKSPLPAGPGAMSPSPLSASSATPSATAGSLTSAVALALFVIDRKRYASNFVLSYPVDRVGVQDDYGADFARAHLARTGDAFPVAALGALALAGDSGAYAKLFQAAIVANGSLAEIYRAQLRHVVSAAAPATTFGVLDSFSRSEQMASIAEIGSCGRPIGALLAFRPAPPATLVASSPYPGATDFAARVSLLQSAISQSAAADCVAARSAPRRAPHRAPRRAASPRVRVRPAPKRKQ
jgi:hypothetical protein